MVAVNRRLYTQADYDCQRCGAPETEAMKKAVRDFTVPICDPCKEAQKHAGHGPGSGMMVGHSITRVKIVEGRIVEETKRMPDVPIEKYEGRCQVCFAKEFSTES